MLNTSTTLCHSTISTALYHSSKSGDSYHSIISADLYHSSKSGDLYHSTVSADLYHFSRFIPFQQIYTMSADLYHCTILVLYHCTILVLYLIPFRFIPRTQGFISAHCHAPHAAVSGDKTLATRLPFQQITICLFLAIRCTITQIAVCFLNLNSKYWQNTSIRICLFSLSF